MAIKRNASEQYFMDTNPLIRDTILRREEKYLRGDLTGYKRAYDEIAQVHDRACAMLPGRYIGWNWVHALVDYTENLLDKQRKI